ncbi:acetyltransferase (GNAT) family protein [Propionicimonas paludicola]|uniref:Acetyltransferase (GNAT) family protein n=1 Tax=Propionicimonas paludicola TaxID=185243 RepID=A0A2A9CV45_9ACTN|nr:GNAT family N-acetyltransferase [Propionicimonas paludicola]PFG18016.1 acetyltransferase (GNAT) family protein [Propionicimonas paludicola]
MTDGLRFSNRTEDIDRTLVHYWISELSYWAQGRTRETQDTAIDGSRNYSVHDQATGAQLGYARVITDGATFAWLCDVIVAPHARGRGVGKRLISGIVDDLEPLGLRRILLATADAHGLYAQYGFEPLAQPERWMVHL